MATVPRFKLTTRRDELRSNCSKDLCMRMSQPRCRAGSTRNGFAKCSPGEPCNAALAHFLLERRGPHPDFGHLVPFFEREKAKLIEITAFSRVVRMGEGGRSPDEGFAVLDLISSGQASGWLSSTTRSSGLKLIITDAPRPCLTTWKGDFQVANDRVVQAAKNGSNCSLGR